MSSAANDGNAPDLKREELVRNADGWTARLTCSEHCSHCANSWDEPIQIDLVEKPDEVKLIRLGTLQYKELIIICPKCGTFSDRTVAERFQRGYSAALESLVRGRAMSQGCEGCLLLIAGVAALLISILGLTSKKAMGVLLGVGTIVLGVALLIGALYYWFRSIKAKRDQPRLIEFANSLSDEQARDLFYDARKSVASKNLSCEKNRVFDEAYERLNSMQDAAMAGP